MKKNTYLKKNPQKTKQKINFKRKEEKREGVKVKGSKTSSRYKRIRKRSNNI